MIKVQGVQVSDTTKMSSITKACATKTFVTLRSNTFMEPEVREFLKRISLSLGIGLMWMILNSTFGIMFDFAFIHEGISLGNILFYVFFLSSFGFMLWLYMKLWKKPLEK